MDVGQQMALVLAHMRHGVVMYDGEEKIRLINAQVGTIFGFKPNAITVGSSLSEYITCVGASVGWPSEMVSRIIENHRIWEQDGHHKIIDQHFSDGRIFEIAFVPIDSGGAMLTFTDVTHERNIKKIADERERLARQTNTMLDSVEKISYETRILAFNARIEAARIGIEGLGFSVIADEIRDLSRRISKVIIDIQQINAVSMSLGTD